jgi:hypothetical protein
MSLAAELGIPLDLSELEDRTFTCLDKCGLCCLCQAELLPSEEDFFKKHFPKRLVTKS